MLLKKTVPIDLLNTGLSQAFTYEHALSVTCRETRYACIPNGNLASFLKYRNSKPELVKYKDEAKTAQTQKIQQTERSLPSSLHRLIPVVSKSQFVTMAQAGCEWKCDEDGETR